ncbi:MAG TPA: 3'-5' exonuclease, partial [Sunxiuqinia sp.]|nr:3'-5' exonuclease [Sunxiuqinia sp.]
EDELKLPAVEIAERAKKSLRLILHDYSRFSISTIDSFFQRVIKSFNRELGINAAYQVDLEENLILEEAVDELLLSIDEDPELFDWLKKFANEKIQEGGGWNLKNDIFRLGSQIYNENFKALNEELSGKIKDKTFISKYKKELNQITHQFENNLKRIGRAGLLAIQEHGVSVTEFKYGKNGAANSFQRLADGNFDGWPGKRAVDAAEDVSLWIKKSDKANILEAADVLQPLLNEAVSYFFKKLHDYNTAKMIAGQLYTLGILVDLRAMVHKVTQGKGVVLISDSGTLLKNIIDDSETPFIYEKTGVFYKHFMIDEFQDTSGLQWGNFRPLIENSLAEDNLGMVVGDVKQAIYRWRNGDWNLLASQVAQQFPNNGVNEETLQQNWRSTGNVIRFNNSLFQLLPQLLQQHVNGEMADTNLTESPMASQIESVYGQSIQEVAKTATADAGAIRMRLFRKPDKDEKEELEATILDELISQIKTVQDLGASARDIAVLVRTQKEAKTIADRLLLEKNRSTEHYNFNVLSSESLYVKNSSAVSFILALLHLLVDPSDQVSLALANHLYYNELFEQLKALNKVPNLSQTQSDQLNLGFQSYEKPDDSSWFEQLQNDGNTLSTFLQSDYFSELLSSRNIQEIIFKCCELFYLFELKPELAYLQAFIDQVSTFMKNRTTDIAAFLTWWEEQGQKKTIAVSEDLNAIRIQTIHKAKGLEYNYVFIPFCDWKIDISAQFAPILWCKPKLPPFNQLELVPVKFEKRMGESIFFEEYFQEKISHYIDNLNLLYVALTRARVALFTWSVENGKMSSIADVLFNAVEQADNFALKGDPSLFVSLADFYAEESGDVSIGELTYFEREKKEKGNFLLMDDFHFTDFHNHLSLRKRHEHFFTSDKLASTKINKGKIIHEVLANIETANDVNAAVNDLIFKGLISSVEGETMKLQLQELLADPEVKNWFDGSCRVMNERSILSGKKHLKRPDRIMLNGEQVVVVDYKSGEKELEKYHYQVKGYMSELKKCGYTDVEGYIWYTQTNKRVRVA